MVLVVVVDAMTEVDHRPDHHGEEGSGDDGYDDVGRGGHDGHGGGHDDTRHNGDGHDNGGSGGSDSGWWCVTL